jgi:hypothetical protein
MKKNVTRRDFLKKGTAAVAGGTVAGTAGSAGEPDVHANGRSGEFSSITERPRRTPVTAECDVCVIGGSGTGVFAAVQAARLGAKVCLVEANGFFGGVATASMVNVWHSTTNTTGEREIIAGLTKEVIERLKKRDACNVRGTESVGYELNTEVLKVELDDLVLEAGVHPFLHTLFVEPAVEDGKPVAAIIEDKSGRRAIRARFFIDATGDGDFVHRLGVPTYKHDNIQPPTMCAIIRGLREIRENHPDFRWNQVIFDPQYADALRKGFAWSASVPGSDDDTMLAATRAFGADCSIADELTMASIEGRRQVDRICRIFKEHFIEDRTVPLTALPTKIGIRETRHVRCLKQLTEKEVLHGKRFTDAIANGTYRVDIHLANEDGLIFRYLDGREQFVSADGSGKSGRWREKVENPPTFYQVPYRSLVPRDTSNVLIAGRMIDADQGAFGAVRVMVNCNQMGQAAGVAAWLALQSDRPAAEIDTLRLRSTLKEHGAAVV